jgi:hypothetical protein
MEHSRSLEANSLSPIHYISRHSWNSWLQCSQELATASCPKPEKFSRQSVSLRTTLILCFRLRLGLPNGFFLSGFTANMCAFLICSMPCPFDPLRYHHPNNVSFAMLYERRNTRVIRVLSLSLLSLYHTQEFGGFWDDLTGELKWSLVSASKC